MSNKSYRMKPKTVNTIFGKIIYDRVWTVFGIVESVRK